MKKLLLFVLLSTIVANSSLQATQTHYYYNETGLPIQVKVTYTLPPSSAKKHGTSPETCKINSFVLRKPTEQMPEPWKMLHPASHCSIKTIEATVKKDGRPTIAEKLEYRGGFQGQGEFTIRETEKGSGKYAVLEYKE